jgi:hypothetical protein
MPVLDLSDENLTKTHNKEETVWKAGFWFHDLQGNPLWIENVPIITWKPKSEES